MADFSRPEYASYVALCRELKLTIRPGHRIGMGDWFAHPDSGEAIISDHLRSGLDDAVWLPTLSDWLEMRELSGIALWHDENLDENDEVGESWIAQPCEGGVLNEREFIAPTPEEAAARLWMTVRKPVEATERLG